MKLHEMTSTEARKSRNRVGRGPGSGNGKTSAVDRKVRKQEAVEAFVLVSKVDRHH